MFTREISSRDETRPGMKSSLSVVKCLLLFFFSHVFTEMKFHAGMKDRDEISSRDEKKKKRRVNTSSQDEILK